MKKYDILVVNGCSFTHGPYDTEQKRENAFSVNMAKELGCVHSNLSKPGGSNAVSYTHLTLPTKRIV